MRKIAHIFNSIEYSGAERMIFTLQDFYNFEFIPFAVSTGKDKGEFYDEFQAKFTCTHLPVSYHRNFNYIINLLQFIRYYKINKINIVHIHPCRRFIFHVLAAKLGGVDKIIRQVHNNFDFEGKARKKEMLSRWFSKMFGVSMISISSSVFKNELDRFKNKTIRINNFYDENKIFPGDLEEKTLIRKELNIPEDSFVLVSVGTCTERKQHDHILEVIAGLKKEIPEIFYIHLGSGELEKAEKSHCKKLNIEKSVLFCGNIDNVRPYLVASDLYVMTSKIEGLSIACIEAMGAKIPAILYATPGSVDLGTNGAPGILVKANTYELKQGILELYHNRSNLLVAAEQSFRYAINEHSKKQAIINWKNVYFD